MLSPTPKQMTGSDFKFQGQSSQRGGKTSRWLIMLGGGSLVIGLWGFLFLALFAMLAMSSGDITQIPTAIWHNPRIGSILWSAVSQALCSALLSVCVAVPASVVLARRYDWFGMGLLRMLTGLAFVVPTTVAASGLLAIWGRHGVINQGIDIINAVVPFVSLPDLPSFFGLKAVILAHIFFNAPLMIRVFLPRLLSVPDNHWRLARMLGMTPLQQFRWVEWPALRPMVLPLIGLVFLFCFSSFALVLMLGGGPRVTTLEVEIYAAIRIAFDLDLAVGLTVLQVMIAFVVLGVMLMHPMMRQTMPQAVMIMRPPGIFMLPSPSPLLKGVDMICIFGLVVLLILPLLALIIKGIGGDMLSVINSVKLWRAMGNSVTIALTSAILVTGFAMLLAEWRVLITFNKANNPHQKRAYRGKYINDVILLVGESSIMIYLILPAIVMGTAWFILLRDIANVFVIAPFLVLMANVMMALPVAYRLIIGKWMAMRQQDERLRLAYGIRGFRGFRYLTVPVMSREIGLIFGMVAAMSMGDLGVIALFASADFETLPWLLFQQAGRYRVNEAAATALILIIVVVILFSLGQGLGRWLHQPKSLHKTGVHHA
jgi:thiamine transport system permease protein